MIFNRLRSNVLFTSESKRRAVQELSKGSAYDADFKVLLVGAIMIATGAIFTDNTPVLIASMIIAPLATPILALGMGTVQGDGRMIAKALATLLSSCLMSLIIAAILTLLLGGNKVANVYVVFTGDRSMSFMIAVVAGCIGSYGLLSTRVASAMTGVAIAVSLMPPLVATSVNLVLGNIQVGVNAAILFGLNVLGILLASIAVFWWFNIGKAHQTSEM